MLIRICDEHEDVIDLIDQAVKEDSVQGKRNDLNIVDNIHEVKPDGNTKQAGLRRLRVKSQRLILRSVSDQTKQATSSRNSLRLNGLINTPSTCDLTSPTRPGSPLIKITRVWLNFSLPRM